MEFPQMITDLPEVALPFPPDGIRAFLMQSERGQVVFFEILKDAGIPLHSHGGQWGTVLAGTVELAMDGRTSLLTPGCSYTIPAGAVHSAKLAAGTKFLDFFEEPDRHKAK